LRIHSCRSPEIDAIMAADPKDAADPTALGNVIAVICPCGKKVSVKAEHAGKKVRCGKCKRVLTVLSTVPEEEGEWLASAQPNEQTLDEVPKPKRDLCAFLAPAQSADELGRLGPYRVLKVLGAGGMGVVFKAEDPGLKRFVALKAMLPTVAENASAKDRFLREARTAAALKHDHVVNIHQVGEDRGVPYLAMEFLAGESLEDRLRREVRLSVAETLRIGRELADGLAAAHEQGLIHRDIKPANVWMESRSMRRKAGATDVSNPSSSRAKILDFGLARGADDASITQSGAILGTPSYMAPEQARGERVDARCDLYSLGVVLYRMVTGQMPFKGSSTLAVLSALALETPAEPRTINSNVPTRLNDLIVRLLSKEATQRPESALEVFAALSEIEEEPSVQVPAPAFTTMESEAPSPKPSAPIAAKPVEAATGRGNARRWPLMALGAGGMALLAALIGIILYWPSPHGTVRIESDDPMVVIVFDKTGPTIKGTGKTPISLQSGPHGLLVKRGDLELLTDRFVMKDGETLTLKVELLKDKIELSRDGQILASAKSAKEKVDPPAAVKAGVEMTNSIGMKLMSIPPGKFMMGSPASEEQRKPSEHPHEVEITKGFWLGKYEVTQDEYERLMGENPSQFKGPKLPVESVNWDDAKEFCRRLSEKEGKKYTLPSEAEWEYACRAGTKSPFSTGENLTTDQANYDGNSPYAGNAKGISREKTTEVGTFAANGFGLHDMHGNVSEWCEDWYRSWYGSDDKNAAAVDPKGPLEALDRVIRGGSWTFDAGRCRSANRAWSGPVGRGGDLGFRVALRSVK
jgi:formylglycine-generating enzyme required for sulfatase activity/serine/threonine protein kinase